LARKLTSGSRVLGTRIPKKGTPVLPKKWARKKPTKGRLQQGAKITTPFREAFYLKAQVVRPYRQQTKAASNGSECAHGQLHGAYLIDPP